MRFLLDMGISPAAAALLRSQGADAVHLDERGLSRLVDSATLDLARAERRILVTHDLEFGEFVAAAGTQLPSVITFRLRDMRPEHVNRDLLQLLTRHEAVLERGAFVTVTEGRIRIRSLPLRAAEEESSRPTRG
jgi:predicted nuclease of predicted toxin-antitoxin system